MLRPQWNSWLARGAYILVGFTGVAGLWWLLELAAYLGWLPEATALAVRPVAMAIGLPLAVGVAVYTAFLFGQAEGRDLWQSTLLPLHLIVQAVMVGSGSLLLLNVFLPLPEAMAQVMLVAFVAGLLTDLVVTFFGEFGMPHASEVAAAAAHDISHGHYKNHFWWGSIVLGHLLPLGLLVFGQPVLAALAAAAAVVGLYYYEFAFVMAPQDVPNS